METTILELPKKQCSRCGIRRSVKVFSPQKDTKDGLNSWCRPCHTESRQVRESAVPYRAAFPYKEHL